MSYERTTIKKAKGDSLDSFVQNLSSSFSVQIKARNSAEEMKFNKAVLEDNISLSDQLVYRQDQLKKVSDDPEEKKRIQGEISNLKDRIEQKNFSDAYLEKLVSYESGMSSIDSVLDFLKQQKASATDPTIIDAINKEISTQSSTKFTLTTNLIKDQTNFALNDKSVSVINEQIEKVGAAKNKALLAGDENSVANFNLQLQSLNKALTENKINTDIKNFAASNITGYASATALLDAYNSKISSASDNTPITIGDITYSSAKEFWTYKRDSYVSDSSSAGLFGRISTEVKDKIETAASKNILNSSSLNSYTSDISSLSNRPELSGYESKIDYTKQSLLQTGADLITNTVTDRYAVDYDLNKAIGTLNELKSTGVNVDSAYAKIIVAGANVKSGQVNSILSAAQNALANDPRMTPEQAIATAISSGAAVVKSPQDLAGASAGALATDLAANKNATANTNDPRLSTPGATTVTPTPTPSTQTTSTPTGNLQYGSTGDSVKKLQTALGITADGVFGSQTKAAVTAYQQKNGLTVDGIVGPQTNASLFGNTTSTPVATVNQPVTPSPKNNTQTQNPTPKPPVMQTPTPTPPVSTPTPTTTPTQKKSVTVKQGQYSSIIGGIVNFDQQSGRKLNPGETTTIYY